MYNILIPGFFSNSDPVNNVNTEYRFGFNGMLRDDDVRDKNATYTAEEGRGNSYDFGARVLNPRVGSWLSLDPLRAKYPSVSSYVFANNNPIIYVDKDGRDAILILFPDYKIATPIGRIGGLGHAGVLLINNKTGVTKYYEYGRYKTYDGVAGKVQTLKTSKVVLDKDGKPTIESLNNVLGEISKGAGKGGRILGAYIKSDQFDAMNNYANEKLKENKDPKRDPYSLNSNNCGTFGADCINQDKTVDQPTIINPTPMNIIDEYLEEGNAKVTYDPKTKKTTIGIGDETDAKVKQKK